MASANDAAQAYGSAKTALKVAQSMVGTVGSVATSGPPAPNAEAASAGNTVPNKVTVPPVAGSNVAPGTPGTNAGAAAGGGAANVATNAGGDASLGAGGSTTPSADGSGANGGGAAGVAMAASAGGTYSGGAGGPKPAGGAGGLGGGAFGAMGARIDGSNIEKETTIGRTNSGPEVDAMAGDDPDNYFTRIDLGSNLFKIVEKRYRAKATQWAIDPK